MYQALHYDRPASSACVYVAPCSVDDIRHTRLHYHRRRCFRRCRDRSRRIAAAGLTRLLHILLALSLLSFGPSTTVIIHRVLALHQVEEDSMQLSVSSASSRPQLKQHLSLQPQRIHHPLHNGGSGDPIPIEDALCNVEDLETANDSQLHSILVDLTRTSFFRSFTVDLETKCPLSSWRRTTTTMKKGGSGSKDNHQLEDEKEGEEEEFECPSGRKSNDSDDAERHDADEPQCSVVGGNSNTGPQHPFESNALHFLQSGGFQSQSQKDTYTWSDHSNLIVQELRDKDAEADCEGNSFDLFWMDICSSIATTNGKSVNLQLNPERNTGYNGTHIWKAIYEENCLAAGDMCLEERVLYRMLSGLHTSTTLSIAYNYYAPSKRKGRLTWEPNPDYFMDKVEAHPERLRNLYFAYVVLLRAVSRASNFLKSYEIRTGNIVEDETATVLLRRLLDSSILGSCNAVFDAFDESLLWKNNDVKIQKDFKEVFHNVSSILDCVQCQQCKLHGKLTMLGYGAALKVLFMSYPVLERNEIVALINTVAKFSESLLHVRELTNLYWQSMSNNLLPPTPTTTFADLSDSALVDQAVQAIASLGRLGRISIDREAELVKAALERQEILLILAKHYGFHLDKFLLFTDQSIPSTSSRSATDVSSSVENVQPDAVIVGSGLAGLAVALNLLDRGGRVLIIEKEHLLGGNSNKASSGINGCCLPDEVDATGDSLDKFRADTIKSAGASAQPELIETLVNRSASAITWLKNRVGVDLSLLSQLGGHATKRTHRPNNGMAGAEIIYHLSKAVRTYEKSGRVQILTDTKVTELLTEDTTGRVIGVKVQFLKNATELDLEAVNVVLATGGFAADRSTGSYLDMYRPELLKMPATAGSFSTGDGVSLATALGAATVDMDKVQIHPTGWIDPSDPNNPSKILAAELLRGVGGILLNEKGQRFCNELGTRASVVDKMLSHDETYKKSQMWSIQSKIPNFHLVLSSSAASDAKKHVDLYTHKGLMRQIKGINALANHTGLPADTLISTFDQYIDNATSGKDDFGKASFRGMPANDLYSEIFYVGMITPVLHYCMGGITIDSEGNVLKANGEIIRGLHAAGEVSGGVHGVNRLGGNSLLECTVFGTIVGQKLPISAVAPPKAVTLSSGLPNVGLPELRPVAMAELSLHNNADDCWVAIHDIVYDLTDFADDHPAGALSIHNLAGTNGTDAFAAVHNQELLHDFEDSRMGRLVGST